MTDALLIAPVLIPMLMAPIVILIGNPRVGWVLSCLAAFASAGCAWMLIGDLDQAPLHYHFGNWPPPFGIEFVLDGLNTPILFLTSVAAGLALMVATPSSTEENFANRRPIFYALFLLCLTGLNGILSTGDVFNVFVFLEISSLTTYGLVAAGPRAGSALAAFQYLILGTLGGSFVLLGIGFWFQATGSLNMADVALRLTTTPYTAVGLAGTLMLMLGFSLKAASFPLHQWLPAVYSAAPWPVTAFLAACATKVAIYALVRMVIGVGDLGAAGLAVLGFVALVGVLWGAIAACFQSDIRRMLAWSSVSQLAYIIFAFSLGTAAGVVAAMVQFFAHAAIKGGIFLTLGPARHFDDIAGLRDRDFLRTALLTLLTMGLLGVPLTAGFAAKWTLLSASFDGNHNIGLVVLVLGSLIAVVYCLRLMEPVWLRSAPQQASIPLLRGVYLLPPLVAVSAMFLLGTTPWAASMGRYAATALGAAP